MAINFTCRAFVRLIPDPVFESISVPRFHLANFILASQVTAFNLYSSITSLQHYIYLLLSF
jgi:hypothetical protein